jgi:hypothetical protein
MISDAALKNLKHEAALLLGTRAYSHEPIFDADQMDSVIESYEETREQLALLRSAGPGTPTHRLNQILWELEKAIDELILRAVPDWGEPGMVPTEDGYYLFQFLLGNNPFLLQRKDGFWWDGEEPFKDWNDLSVFARIPIPREKP